MLNPLRGGVREIVDECCEFLGGKEESGMGEANLRPYIVEILCYFLIMSAFVGSLGCALSENRKEEGVPAEYLSPVDPEAPCGVGIDPIDLIQMTDRMMQDILVSPFLARLKTAPKVIIDAKYFSNEGASRINKNMITDRLRIGLNKFGGAKMVFVCREQMNLMLEEKKLAQAGITADDGTIANGQLTGAEFRLAGRIATLDSIQPRSGIHSRYHQILFEIIDLKSGAIVWTNSYDFKKFGQEDIVYR